MKRALLAGLAGYKRWISPALPNSCRFVPTCSEYAIEAVERHGVIVGSALALGRLLRCHPFSRAGHDPVPVTIGRDLVRIDTTLCPARVAPEMDSHRTTTS